MRFKDIVKAFTVGALEGLFELGPHELVASAGLGVIAEGIREKDLKCVIAGGMMTLSGATGVARFIERRCKDESGPYDKLVLGKSFDEWIKEI